MTKRPIWNDDIGFDATIAPEGEEKPLSDHEIKWLMKMSKKKPKEKKRATAIPRGSLR